jgi:hypothetical protein
MRSSLLPPQQNLQINGYFSLLFYLMVLFIKKKKDRKKKTERKLSECQEEHWTIAERSVEPTHLVLVIAAGTTIVFV